MYYKLLQIMNIQKMSYKTLNFTILYKYKYKIIIIYKWQADLAKLDVSKLI